MSRASRAFDLLAATWAAASLLVPLTTASPAPSPSPALDSVLAEPSGSGYAPTFQSFTAVQGNFEAVDFLVFLGPPKPSETYRILQADGFVAGYGRAWFNRTARHSLVELVIAFNGGQGATKWLTEWRSVSEGASVFTGEFSVVGVDGAFGIHYADTSAPFYDDVVGFVKGNDFFLVEFFSDNNDLANAASTQAKQMFDSAPVGTIPAPQWPENVTSSTPTNSSRLNPVVGLPVGLGVIVAVAGVLLLVLASVAVVLVRRAGRPTAASPPAVEAVSPAVPAGLQMSADGNHWWDGQAWKDASQEVPPMAQRSPDGYYWWDGKTWREVPRPS